MSIFAGIFTNKYASFPNSQSFERRAWYLFYTNPLDKSDPSYSAGKTAVLTYGQYFILLNTIIPISLIVSLEFVKLLQTPFIANDIEMYDSESMKLC
jgi:magnesium-transporting ATPase (P-type)